MAIDPGTLAGRIHYVFELGLLDHYQEVAYEKRNGEWLNQHSKGNLSKKAGGLPEENGGRFNCEQGKARRNSEVVIFGKWDGEENSFSSLLAKAWERRPFWWS